MRLAPDESRSRTRQSHGSAGAGDAIIRHSDFEVSFDPNGRPANTIAQARDLIRRLGPESFYFLIMDRNGDLKASTLSDDPPKYNYADRFYVQAHEAGAEVLVTGMAPSPRAIG